MIRRDEGQVLPLIAAAMVVLLLMAGLVVDMGRVWVTQRKLQDAVDASALAAGQDLPNASQAYTAAMSYGGATQEQNTVGGTGVTASAPTVTFECVSHGPNYTSGSPPTCPSDSSNSSCQPTGAQAPQPTGVTTCNAVVIKESATVKTTFLGLALPSFKVSVSSTASAAGGNPKPVNAYVILDTTRSMVTTNCGGSVTGITGNATTLDCAKAGMRALLQTLWPCTAAASASQNGCGSATATGGGVLGANVAAPWDEVGLLVFPAISGNPPSTSTLGDEIDCNSSDSFSTISTQWTSYTYNSSKPDGGIPSSDDYLGYQAVGLSSDYRLKDSSTSLNETSSDVADAVDWKGCSGGVYPGGTYYGLKDIGGQGSYLAGAITEAQHLLNANARAGASNAIIVLSDGELTDPKSPASDSNPCNSAISAATQAKAAGTTIYSIDYGSAPNTSCPDTSHSYTALQTMQDIASGSSTFFNDPSATNLVTDFSQVAAELGGSRLIPDCTSAPPAC